MSNSCISRTFQLLTLVLMWGFPVAAEAQTGMSQLGVVRNKENAGQWKNITARLEASGVKYCIVEGDKWREADFNRLKVLLIPNVETFNTLQAGALNNWVKQGGQVIATGPTGNLTQPEVRSQLRNLLGAYWAFPLGGATTIELAAKQDWLTHNSLYANISGGAIMPTKSTSQIIGVWLAPGSPSAVVVTPQTTILGWRWGTDAADIATDTAWLQASIRRYGSLNATNGTPAELCYREGVISLSSKPLSTPLSTPTPATINVTPKNSAPTNLQVSSGGRLNQKQIQQMNEELQGLIGRYETALVSADARHSQIGAPTTKVVERIIGGQVKQISSRDTRYHQALDKAKSKLRDFQQLISKGEYKEARQVWLSARNLLWDNYPAEVRYAQPEIRAIWLDRGTIVKARSEQDLAKVFDRMAEAGINTIFFETVNASYTIYPSRVAPEQNPLTKGWDPLRAAVKLARERGMELHAWVWVFAAANQRHNIVLNQPVEYLGPVLSRRPDWAITDKKGGLFDHSSGYKKAFLDPANPEVQKYVLTLIEEIVNNYDVDGIQLDYIRYPFQDVRTNQTFGYSNISRDQFKQETGVDPISLHSSSRMWSQWTGFRIRQVDKMVESISKLIKEKRPNIILSTAVFPIPRQDRLFRLQQNWEEWGLKGWVDIIVLMTYAIDTGNLETLTNPVFEKRPAGNALVIPGIRLLNLPIRSSLDQIQFLRGLPSGGYALFAMQDLTVDLQRALNRTQGNSNQKPKEPLPYRQPFQTAALRYQALQSEWGLLLTTGQLTMDSKTLKQWSEQADWVGNTLNTLASKPNSDNLGTAKNAILAFQSQLSRSLGQQNNITPYQMKVWQNRLEVIDKLLDYGETSVATNSSTLGNK